MAGNDSVKSQSITFLDAVPIVESNAGQGQSGRVVEVDDYCAATAAGLQSSGSFYKLVRIPTGACVKSVEMAADAGPNLNGSLAFQLDLVFSDSTDDGTPVSLQGLVPTTANTGGTITVAVAATGVANNIYGFWKPSASSAAINLTQFVLNGLGANYSFTGGFMNLPLWQIFGFTDARGQPTDPGGYFDLMALVATGATTGGACNIYAKVRYSI